VLRIYLSKLETGGLIAFRVSSNYVELTPAIAALARDAGLSGLDKIEAIVPPKEFVQGRMPSHWILLARRPVDLARLAEKPGWRPLTDGTGSAVWTGAYSDLASLVWWR
jgi:hypothetical protein